MTPPTNPADAFRWALDNSNAAWWIIGLIGAGIAWTSKRLRTWNRRNAPAGTAPGRPKNAVQWSPGAPVSTPAAPAAAAPSSYTAAQAYAASAYAAQPAYAAPPPAPAQHAASSSRKLHREAAPVQRTAAPVARSVDIPAARGAWTLAGAFGDPAHARTAIVIAEVLGPPVGLR